MAEYIEKRDLLKVLPPKCNMGDMYAIAYNTCLNIIENLIKEQPTADVVPVVKAAEILNDAFGNDYPCNFNNIDEWLPYVCEYANTCDCSSVKC